MLGKLESLIAVLDRSKKRLAFAFGISLFLHLPFTPAMPLLKLIKRISGATEQTQATLPREVEVELQEALKSEQQRTQDQKAEPASKAASVRMEPPANVKFAKSSDDEKGQAKPDEPNQLDAKPKPTNKEKVKDLGLEGELASKVVGRPAVTLGLWFSSLRETPLGKELAALAACNRDWKRFVDQGVDLSRDIDAVLVVGPGLSDSALLTAAVGHGLSAERVRGVMDALVKDSGDRGRWIRPDVALVRFGRRDRALLPLQPDLFFVTPHDGWQGLHRVKSPLRVPSAEGRVASLALVGPNRVLAGLGITLPNSISEMRIEAFANQDRSVHLKLELEAKNDEAAQRVRAEVSRELRDFFSEMWMATSALGALAGTSPAGADREPAPRLDLEAEGRTLSGSVQLSANQTQTALSLLSSFVCRKARPSSRAPAR